MEHSDSVTIRDYMERLIEEHDAKNSLRFDAAKVALDKAARELDIRLEGMNQFRSQIEAERRLYVRQEVLEAFRERLDRMEKAVAGMEGRFWVLGIGGLLLGVTLIVAEFVLRR